MIDAGWTRADRPAAAIARIERALPLVRARHGSGSYEGAEMRGLLGMALAAGADDAGALAAFREAVAVLLVRNRGGALATIDVVAESFRLAEAARGRAVQAAVAAAGARAHVPDPEHATLIRQGQDARQQIRFLAGRLRDLDAAPPDQRADADVKRLRADLAQVRAVRGTLLTELEARFPEYARLLNPQPATVAQARAALGPGEALIATYSTPAITLVWALRADAPPSLAVAELGAAAITDAVSRLRASLDPEATILGDIPPFDVDAGHGAPFTDGRRRLRLRVSQPGSGRGGRGR